ncbi:hypothetical protein C3B58_06430 [Lactonifactor longoviformis]|uniref:Uncharacterized protein n=1 Tax=Lactonifactor longoviformis DSM 17459 TaxID=1122155 RepID=A0A1M4T3P5_9CLOT|nr:hypothetical protein C3B58_06430 [Lactonifactor longoviformis]SHE38948.1 hypothetical protein SAMN02745158_00407 [Lactonifactor longoviformis DSM 17459]
MAMYDFTIMPDRHGHDSIAVELVLPHSWNAMDIRLHSASFARMKTAYFAWIMTIWNDKLKRNVFIRLCSVLRTTPVGVSGSDGSWNNIVYNQKLADQLRIYESK